MFISLQTKSDTHHYGPKRNTVIPHAIDDNENSLFGLQKKPKQQDWICTLCQTIATSEKCLNDHLKVNKYKAKETSNPKP